MIRSIWLRTISAASVVFVSVGAMILASFFGVMGVPCAVASVVAGSDLRPYAVLLAILVLYIVLGCFLEGISTMVLTVPTVVPMIEAGRRSTTVPAAGRAFTKRFCSAGHPAKPGLERSCGTGVTPTLRISGVNGGRS